MSRDGATPSQTVGPFFRLGMDRPEWSDLTRGGARGEKIAIEGRVLDGDGAPVDDAVLEIWQADAEGSYDHPDDGRPADPRFHGFGRAMTDEAGRYRFVTIKPGAYPWRNHLNAWRPQHIHFSVFGRAFTQRLVTQMYFPGDPLFFQDPIFNSVPDEEARQRMISKFDMSRTVDHWALAYEWDIVVRGREASVFEDEEDE